MAQQLVVSALTQVSATFADPFTTRPEFVRWSAAECVLGDRPQWSQTPVNLGEALTINRNRNVKHQLRPAQRQLAGGWPLPTAPVMRIGDGVSHRVGWRDVHRSGFTEAVAVMVGDLADALCAQLLVEPDRGSRGRSAGMTVTMGPPVCQLRWANGTLMARDAS